MLSKKDIGKSVGVGFAIAVGLCTAYETITSWRERRFVKQMEREYDMGE